jgi:predicted TPR repeat methyltransferase
MPTSSIADFRISNVLMLDLLMKKAMTLHRAGQLGHAAQLYQQMLRSNPRRFDALHHLGMLHVQAGQYDDAERVLGEATQLNPRSADAICFQGIALLFLRRHEEAIACFDRALAIKPDLVVALTNRATALLATERFEAAITGFDAALAHDPRHAIGWNNRGNALFSLKRYEEALASFDTALEIDPSFSEAADNRSNTLFMMRRLTRSPAGFVRQLFEECSPDYDKQMLSGLGYCAHLHLRTLATRVLPHNAAPWRILDLGSGTGLVGTVFKDLATGGRLDGIDLAPRMIEAARRQGIYDDLILGDLETVLPTPGTAYDLVLAADTMIYLGDLSTTFSGIVNRLVPGGFYLFSVESTSGQAWEQTSAHRFRHSLSYLKAEASRAGFEFVDAMECTLRQETETPVAGFVVALQKPAR